MQQYILANLMCGMYNHFGFFVAILGVVAGIV
jgi:hypothetical protein